jgi:multidrug resistance efflux pump
MAALGIVNGTLIPVIVAILSSGFLLGLLRIMPERKSILVAASETAVKTVNDALETIRAELIESQLKVAKLEGANLAALVERDRLLVELSALGQKLGHVEAQLATVTAALAAAAPTPGPQGKQGERGPQGPPGEAG